MDSALHSSIGIVTVARAGDSDGGLASCQLVMRDARYCGRRRLHLGSPQRFEGLSGGISVKLGPAEGAGDQTVPLRSSDNQLLSGKFRGIFRQTGYEHQASYANLRAVHSTLYSIVKIAATMKWQER